MQTKSIIFLAVLLFLTQCNIPKIKIENTIDPDIVLVNLESIDRASIGKLLLKINIAKPKLIVIDAYFQNEKEINQDSTLISALSTVKNDILIYTNTSENKLLYSHSKFRKYAIDEGLNEFDEDNNLISRMTPVAKIEDQIHQLIPLKIVKHWKPEFNHDFKVDKSIPIVFSRTLNQFVHFTSSEIDDVDEKVLQNKIVIVGYLGPGNEDKHFTPLRFVEDHPENEPDTYGPVIIANAVRTILVYDN